MKKLLITLIFIFTITAVMPLTACPNKDKAKDDAAKPLIKS